jgi:hypothetical protein
MQTTSSIEEQLKSDARKAKRAGIPFNPHLPPNFDCTSNELRPASHRVWWNRYFIRAETMDESSLYYVRWLASWQSGIRYDVRCLDGGAWDRSTNLASFDTVDAAIRFIESARPAP